METIATETYTLPLDDNPPSSFAVTESSPTDVSFEYTTGQLVVTETRSNTGQVTVSVVHEHEQGSDRYRFRVRDVDKRLCRYDGSDSVPWTVYWGLAKYGYRAETAPAAERKHMFDLLMAGSLRLSQHAERAERGYVGALAKRVAGAAHQLCMLHCLQTQFGDAQMPEVASWLTERGDWQLGDQELLTDLFAQFDIEHGYLPTAEFHPATHELLDTTDGSNSEPADGETTDEGDGGITLHYTIHIHEGRGESSDIVYAALVTANSIEWFSFRVTDQAGNECAIQADVVGDFPPWSIVKAIEERTDLTVTNLPKFEIDNQPLRTTVFDLDALVRRVHGLDSPTGTLVQGVNDQYLKELNYLIIALSADMAAPDEYAAAVDAVASALDTSLTHDVVERLDIETVDKITAIGLQQVTNQDEVEDLIKGYTKQCRIQARLLEAE